MGWAFGLCVSSARRSSGFSFRSPPHTRSLTLDTHRAANAILLHAFVYAPRTFPTTYSSFILRFSSAYLPSPPSPSSSWPTPRALVDAIATSSCLHYPAFISPLLHPSSKMGFNAEVARKGGNVLEAIRPVLDDMTHTGHRRLICAFLHPEEVGCWEVFAR